jgi:predicted transcriptional regulator
MGKSKSKTVKAGQATNKPVSSKADLPGKTGKSSSRWTFLTNHAHVLILLNNDSGLVLREVAARIGITERAVQKIVHDLIEDGFVKCERIGRKNRYKVKKNQPLRHSIESHCKIGELLQLIDEE